MALGSFPLALRGAELLVLDKLKAGSKFTWCRYGTATVQLLCSHLCFCFRCFPAPVAISQCYSCCLLRVLLFPFCGYLTTALGPAHLRVVASGLWSLAVTVHLLLPRPFLWLVLPSPAHHLPANSLTSPAGAGLLCSPGSLQWSRPALKGGDSLLRALPLPLSSFCCWISRWRSCVHDSMEVPLDKIQSWGATSSLSWQEEMQEVLFASYNLPSHAAWIIFEYQ